MSKHKNTGIPRATHAGIVQQMFRYQSLAKKERASTIQLYAGK